MAQSRIELSCSQQEGGKKSSGKLIIVPWELLNRVAAEMEVKKENFSRKVKQQLEIRKVID